MQDLRVAVGDDPFLAAGANGAPSYNLGLLSAGPDPGIFETLTQLTPDFGVAGGLALRWESPDPATWRFFLRPGVTFHNGAPFNAAAVVSTLETVAKRQTRPRGLDPGAATATADDVVEVHLSMPNARLPEQLANPTMAMVAPGTSAGAGPDPATTATGTGPFRFDSYSAKNLLKVVANDHWWGGKPQLSSITFRFGPESDASRLLATRQVELVGQVAYESLAKVSGRTDHPVASPPARPTYLLLNTGGIDQWTTLKDDAVRKAIELALDRRAVARMGWPDDGDPSDTLIPPQVLGSAADRVRLPGTDPAAAGHLLDQAGWTAGPDGVRTKDGRPLSLSLMLARPPEEKAAADELVAELGRVGITVSVTDPSPDSPFVRVNNATYDLFLTTSAQDDANPCALCRFFSIRPGGQLTYSGTVGGGPKADDLFDTAYAAPSIDTARRTAADLMQVVTVDRVTAIPLATLRTEWLVSPRVQGFTATPLGGAQTWDRVYLTP
ncbi:MAG: ABC transporter substrate-binding protein [Acidimicrobiales bacterium]